MLYQIVIQLRDISSSRSETWKVGSTHIRTFSLIEIVHCISETIPLITSTFSCSHVYSTFCTCLSKACFVISSVTFPIYLHCRIVFLHAFQTILTSLGLTAFWSVAFVISSEVIYTHRYILLDVLVVSCCDLCGHFHSSYFFNCMLHTFVQTSL